MKRFFLAAVGFLLLAPAGFAIVDANSNGLSDLWEKAHHHGELFAESFEPQSDPDADGWTNAQEAAAGTSPFKPNKPDGFVCPEIAHVPAVLGEADATGVPLVITPEAVTITWPTIAGKQYSLQFSPDLSLGSWIPVGSPFIGDGDSAGFAFEVNDADQRFWRVAVGDVDSDHDGLSDAEEHELSTNPQSLDSDGDGLTDAEEAVLGTNPNNPAENATDHDGDGIANELDADPADAVVNWQASSPAFAVIETDVENVEQLTYLDHTSKGTMLLSRLTAPDALASAVVIDHKQNVHEVPHPGNSHGPSTLIYSRALFDEQVICTRSENVTFDALWDPIEDAYTHWERPSSYDDDIVEVRDGKIIARNWFGFNQSIDGLRQSPDGALLPGEDENASGSASIDSENNIITQNRFIPADSSSAPLPLHQGNHRAGSFARCAVLRQKNKDGVERVWKLACTSRSEGLLVAEQGSFQRASKRFAGDQIWAVTKQGWIFNNQNQVWRNDAWIDMAQVIGTDYIECEMLGVNDEGIAVAKTRRANQRLKLALLVPVEVAPEVLAVNSDFDEGRIDPATGYAIPDCDDMPGVDQKTGSGNTEIALNAARDHLDGLFANDEKVTDDMHKGWFGVNPKSLKKDFWDGANVTIRKIDKIDDETGYKESGQVRFYAKWGDKFGPYYGITPYDLKTLEPINLVTSGVNGRECEGVYGSTSTIPDDAQFWMEGVRPGKITLEWRYQKGNIDVKHEQTFKVETRKTVGEWQEEVRYQIRLQTKVKSGADVDIALYHSGHGFRNTSNSQTTKTDNVLRVQAIYYYYQQLFNQMPEKFMWAGMAKTAAAPIYAGMSDLTTLWQVQEAAGGYGAGTYFLTRGLLCGGQKAIFTDKAWAHRAYMASGIGALDWVKDNGSPDATDYDAWDDLNTGILNQDQGTINSANKRLLQREQRDFVQEYYSLYATSKWMNQPKSEVSWINAALSWLLGFEVVAEDPDLGANVGEWLSANAKKNPMPGGPAFRSVVPGGRVDNYQDRWTWTNNAANGMLQIWTGDATGANAPKFNAGKRLSENNKTMYSAAASYALDTGGLLIE